jgi:hypothetical protein
MRFNDYYKLSVLMESNIQNKLEQNLRPQLVTDVMTILNNNPSSPLVKYIVKRAKDPKSVKKQEFLVSNVGTLESYKMDPGVYEKLLDVKAGDVGPGEVLIALTSGKWVGGTGGDTDVLIDGLGEAEVKYLGPFAHSTNVPFGGKRERLIKDTDFDIVTKSIAKIAKQKPEVLKKNLQEKEVQHFLDDTIDQIFVHDENLSTNSLRIMARLLRNAEENGDKTFSSKGITFERLKDAMETAIKDAVGDAEYLMFLGERTDPDEVGEQLEGQYYIMPKSEVKYYMFYRLYKNHRIKIAPFATESEFFEKTITEEETLLEMPLVHNYEDQESGSENPENWDPIDIFTNDYKKDEENIVWSSGDTEIREVVDIEYDVDDKIINYGLFKDGNLVSATQIDVINGDKFSVEGLMPIVSRSATLESERGQGYSKFLTKFLLKKYGKLASDLELFTRKSNRFGGSVSKWVKSLPKISNVFNFDENTRTYSEFDADAAINGKDAGDIRFVAFDKSYSIDKLPMGDE